MEAIEDLVELCCVVVEYRREDGVEGLKHEFAESPFEGLLMTFLPSPLLLVGFSLGVDSPLLSYRVVVVVPPQPLHEALLGHPEFCGIESCPSVQREPPPIQPATKPD